MNSKKLWCICGITGMVTATVLLAACSKQVPLTAAPPAQASVLTLRPAAVMIADDLPGRVAAVRTAEIRPQVGGIIQRRLFEQGAEIRAGQALFQINTAPLQADVDLAAAALQRAEAAHARARVHASRLAPLLETEAISRQVFDDAASQRDQAAAEVAQARATLSRRRLELKFATVDAPIAGRIDQAQVTEGALVTPNDSSPMARIQQIDRVYIDVRQSASALDGLRDELSSKKSGASGVEGLPATLLRTSGEPYAMTGRILFSGINVDAGTGEVLVRILADNPQRQLLPGMFVRARVPRVTYSDALLVPQQAVARADGKAQVWVVDGHNKARSVHIELGELFQGQYIIRRGLAAGQRVVVEGRERLAEGADVAIRAWSPPASANLAVR
ncbi:multidrug efflux system membrane fusion protein [Variovorax boronicumulans]|uniref:efflux RND transporter periplasmic adaptor subunit n=1 Tax=Variovorax boronicumulans TaxID=436515 RepID=UPI00159D8E18|nr:multidrug efflux system membrane fusion protein [Variovorax boronicumulans]